MKFKIGQASRVLALVTFIVPNLSWAQEGKEKEKDCDGKKKDPKIEALTAGLEAKTENAADVPAAAVTTEEKTKIKTAEETAPPLETKPKSDPLAGVLKKEPAKGTLPSVKVPVDPIAGIAPAKMETCK